jgi:heme exporter protein C
MRLKIILTLTVIAGLILSWDLYRIFLQVPDEANQGAIFRIIYFHVPAAITLCTGSIWGRIIWGIWWTWDPRLTSFFVCWLIYVGYFMLRRAIDDPTARARLSAVLSIFACVDIVLVWKSIEWFRTQHPGPVLEIRGGGGMAPGMEAPLWWNFLAFLMLATALILIRTRQEGMKLEIDALRRHAHAF